MRVSFDPNLELTLRAIGRAADDAGAHAWVVGGVVRDALIGSPVADIDVTIVGDVEGVVRRLSGQWNADVEQHGAFSTATLLAPGYPRVDIVRARRETYARPGALPEVVPSGIDDDLARRDFSVNAIAANLSEARFGEMLDPFSGQADLERRTLRILHSGSFVEDPTRLFRAARYAIRLDIAPDAKMEEAAEAAVRGGALGTISADRRRREVELILDEPRWVDAFVWLNRWGLWESLTGGWTPGASSLKRADVVHAWARRNLRESTPPESELRWLTLLSAAPEPVHQALAVKPAEVRLVASVHRALASMGETDGPAWWRGLDAAPLSVLLAATVLCASDSEKARLTRYLERVRPTMLAINGDDLIADGAQPGPAVGAALRGTLDAVREGRLKTRDEQLHFAMGCVRERGR